MKSRLLKGSRTIPLAIILIIIMTFIVGRLFYLQVIRHDYYSDLASQEQLKKEVIHAKRGEIYALSGNEPVKLVMNTSVFTVYADPVSVDDVSKVVDVMNRVAGGNVVKDFKDRLENKDSRYQVIALRLSRVQAEKIKQENLAGIGFQEIPQRVYPEGSLAAQLLGFVNADGEGNYGIEGYFNKQLAGVDGRLQTVTDIREVPLTIGDQNIRIPAQDGQNIVLTIDRNIQSKVEESIKSHAEMYGADHVSVIVMDPNNAKVMAMANYPSYNPADYYKQTDISVFNNDAISAPYEPGSDMKTYTMATAIDTGAAKATDTYNNTDYIRVEDRTITNAYKGKTGNITFQEAMNWSLNTGFVTLGMRLGNGTEITRQARDTIYRYFHDKLGLGQKTGIGLAGESAGIIIPPTDADGGAVRYSNMTFGQGLDATLLQVSTGFSAIINGGNYYKPTIVAGYMVNGSYQPNKPAPPERSGVVKASTSEDIKQIIHTARDVFYSSQDTPGYFIGGKTGTSQIVKNGTYAPDETVGTYLGFGGSSIDDVKYVIMVSVSGDHKQFAGNHHAMPIFTDISNWLLNYLKVQPKG